MGRKFQSYCCVATCVNSSGNNKDLTFFTLPANMERRKEWLRLIWREDLLDLKTCFRYYNVCEDHFDDDVINKTAQRTMLRSNAVPTLCLPQLGLKDPNTFNKASTVATQTKAKAISTVTQESTFTQTTECDVNSINLIDMEMTVSSRKRKLDPANAKLNTDRIKLENLSKMFLSKQLEEIVSIETKVALHVANNKCKEGLNLSCLDVYNASPETYNMLQEALRLAKFPSMCKQIEVTTEMNNHLFRALHVKFNNMSVLEKQCIIVIDTMPLTSNLRYDEKLDRIFGFNEVNGISFPNPADKALVVMIQGMFSDWKLPVGYALVSESSPLLLKIAYWINELINKLANSGLIIRIIDFVNEAEATFFQKRWVSVGLPYFFIKRSKIYHINDLTMLIKLVRNNLLAYDFHFGERKAKYEHIIHFYNMDKNSKFRLAPKLTERHVFPTASDKQKTSYAFELFSNEVAAGLSTYIDIGRIEEEARGTVLLIKLINKLCECLNSSTDTDISKRIFSGDTNQLKQLWRLKEFFKKIMLVDLNHKEHLKAASEMIESFVTTINSFIGLYDDLMLEQINLLPARVLNQNTSDNFFKQIKKRSGDATAPNVQQFRTAFKKLLIENIPSNTKQCNKIDYFDSFLAHAKKPILRFDTEKSGNQLQTNLTTITKCLNDGEVTVPRSDYTHIDRPERHTLIYVSGYLLKKCKENHNNCNFFKNYTNGVNAHNIEIKDYVRYIKYGLRHNLSLLTIPSDSFVKMVEKMEEKFCKTFKRHQVNSKLERVLFKEMNLCITLLPCPCFPLAYMIKLFIKLRIYYTIQLNNREFKRHQKHFVIPLLLSL